MVAKAIPELIHQCEAPRVGKYLCDKPGEVYQCQNSARFQVQGKNYCLRHAEIKALQILIDSTKLAEEVLNAPVQP